MGRTNMVPLPVRQCRTSAESDTTGKKAGPSWRPTLEQIADAGNFGSGTLRENAEQTSTLLLGWY